MKNNKKMILKTKDEKRRLAFEKRNVKKEKNLIRYGAEGGSALVMAKTTEFNRRIIAAVLALVFVLTTIVVGYNFAVKADDSDEGFNMLSETDDSGFVARKGIRYNENTGKYDLRMEAYATAPIATKAIDTTQTPLDVVFVLNQSESMGTPDIWNGEYEEAPGTFSIENAIGKYYKVDDQYYPVQYETHGYAEVQENNSVKSSWTATEANTIYNSLSSNGRGLYYKNGTDFEDVYVHQYNTYSQVSGNIIDITTDDVNHSWFRGHYYPTSYYVYTPHNGTGADENSCWHRVYYREDGVTADGYYYTFFYFKNKTEGTIGSNGQVQDVSFSNGSKGDEKGSGANTVVLLNDYQSCKCYGVTVFGVELYRISSGYSNFYNSTGNGTDGKVYSANGTSSAYNYLDTANRVLACQEPNTNQSHAYNGSLYTEGWQLYYQTDPNDPSTKQYIGKSVFKTNDDVAYNSETDGGPLYTREYITRTQALQQAASQLAESIATQATTNNVEHRIGVVGYNSTGSVLTSPGLVVANANDTSDEGTVNDIVDTAINDLTATGSRKLDAGLSSAATIFHDNLYEDGWDGKRIVVVFSDEIPDNSTDEVWNAGAVLKDTYNAAVYTVGLWDEANGTSEDFNSYLNDLSSNLFRATPDNTNKAKGDTTTNYYYNSEKNLDTLISRFNNIATSLATPYTSVALDEDNSVLRDIISDNFIVPANPTVTLQTASSSYANDTFSWTTDQTISEDIASNWDAQNKTLSVTGFDYNSNYVTTEQSGKKIIVTIEGLTLKDNAQAGSDRRIYSNEAGSGIYKSNVEDLLFAAFPRPYVDKTSDLVPNGSSGIPNDGAVVNKYLTANENGNYDLTLEAYSTSKNETATTTEKIPTDFVVVVDQSGSMEEADMPTGTATKRNNVNLETVADGAYYYYDEAADQYYKVYGVKDYLYRYYPANYWFTGDIVEHLGADIGWFMGETDATTYIDNAFYFREVVGGKTYYLPIKTTIEGKIGTYYMRFSYPSKKTGSTYEFNREVTTYSSNGNSPWYKNVLNGNVMTSGALWATANAAVQGLYPNDNAYTYSTINLGLAKPRTGMYINYPMYGRHLSYTKLCYRDVNGVEHVLPSNQNNGQTTWEFCDNNGQAITSQSGSTHPTYSNLYTFDTSIRRIDALQSALNEFAKAVANEQDDFGPVDNKISIVGFSSPNSYGYYYDNTELLTGSTFNIQRGRSIPSSGGYSADGYNHNGKAMSDATTEDYAGALVSATDGNVGTVNTEIDAAINALTAYGGTQPENGLAMANSIIDARNQAGKNKYTIRSGDNPGTEVDRNTVVIFFTDGQPGDYHTSNQYAEANEVIEAAKTIKDKGASIFSIGVFGESDGNPLTYTHETRSNSQGEDKAWKYLGGWMESYHDPYYPYSWYCLRRQWRPSNDNYTATANDTIYDYMSVTSSNYPDAKDFIAPAWLNNNFSGNYIAATDGDAVRQKSTAEKTNKYYRMASNQATLVEAFLQAITMNSQAIEGDGTLGPSTILRDILKDGTFKAGANSSITVETVKGKADRNGVVTFENDRTPVALQTSSGDGQYEVTGFDYTVNSIYYGKPEDTENDLAESQGRKLVVTIKNVVPNETITSGENNDKLFSNEDESGLVKSNALKATFPKPAITRHSYTMDVGGANKNAAFEVTTTLVAREGASADLSDVILVKPDGSRVPYTEIQNETFTMANGSTFYFENVPQGYSVQTLLKAPDSFFTYSFWTNNDESNKETLSTKDATTSTLGYSDNVLHVTSVSSYRTVTIAESVSGDYANESDVFDVELTLTKPDGDPFDEDTITLADGVVLEKKLNGKYKATITGLPGNQEEKVLKVPAKWTLDVDPIDHEKYDVETGYPKYNTQEDSTQVGLPENGVVITSELTNIFINNVAKDIPVTGIPNFSSHNWIIYLLVGIAAIAVISGGIFLWKKRNEFVEE